MPPKKSTATDATTITWEEFMLSMQEFYTCLDNYTKEVQKGNR